MASNKIATFRTLLEQGATPEAARTASGISEATMKIQLYRMKKEPKKEESKEEETEEETEEEEITLSSEE